MFYVLSGLLALATALSVGALLLRALFHVQLWSPLLLRALLMLGFLIWVEHLRQVWNPLNWGGAVDTAGSWPGLILFTAVSLGLGLVVWVLGFMLAGRLPLLAAILPLGWTLLYRWILTGLLRWRAPADFYLEDDPYGMWLFIRMFVLTACQVVYALLFLTSRRPGPAVRAYPIWLLATLLGLAACNGRDVETGHLCVGTGGPSVLVEVRGPDGSPAAIGTKVVIRDGTFVDSGGAWDELRVGAGERRPGCYQVEVSKPGYERVLLRDVMAPGDTVCNYAEPTDIRAISLRLLPDAPPVRSIVVLPNVGVSLGPDDTTRFRVVVDAAPGVSRAVRWSSSDTAVATVSPSGLVTAGCLPASNGVVIAAVSVADPQIRAEGSVWVESPTSLPPPEALIGPGAEEARARQRECLARVRATNPPEQ